jgi:uncharacterized protein (TIGR00725 family)
MNTKRVISVCGGHKDTKFSAEAYELGKGIALRGYVLITGGGGGIMESASRGAAENGGLVIGVLPSERKNPLDGYPNPYVSIPVYTGMSDARNAIIAKSPDVLVALGGGAGTLSEIGLAVKSRTPVIIIGDSEFRLPEDMGCIWAGSAACALREIERILSADKDPGF